MSTLTCFDADPDMRIMVQRLADCARHPGGHQTSDYRTRQLARLHDDAVETHHAESERAAAPDSRHGSRDRPPGG